jgi:hypothetical protein
MKKLFGITLVALLGFSAPLFAQNSVGDKVENGTKKAWSGTKKGAKKAWYGTKKGAKAVGNKTAELASKGAANVHDKKSDEWVGPAGQTIYVDDGNKYYWVNNKGKRIFVNESDLKARNKQ